MDSDKTKFIVGYNVDDIIPKVPWIWTPEVVRATWQRCMY